MKNILFICLLFLTYTNFAQTKSTAYTDTINLFQKKYVDSHEVVKGADRKFLQFFTPDISFNVVADFEKLNDAEGFSMPTSLKQSQQYYKYGKLRFKINGKPCQLFIYQAKDLMLTKEYSNYLFIPFTDASNGTTTYEGGRYLDLTMQEIKESKVKIDFNKAYNPYCNYQAGYSCPIPPKENALQIAVNAGEKKYAKPVH